MLEGLFSLNALPSSLGAETAPAWSDILANRILTIAAILLVLLMMRTLFRLLPALLACIDRPRGSFDMELNVSLSRMRNELAVCCILPFCLIVDRFSLYPARFILELLPQWRVLLTLGVFAAYLLLRAIPQSCIRLRKLDGNERLVVKNFPRSLFIVLTLFIVPLALLLSALGLSDELCRYVLWGMLGLVFLFMLFRISQFLKVRYSFLPTILYLCALEIMPAAVVVASALLF